MAKYVFSYRVPADCTPGPETGDEWQAWLGGMGSSLVDFGGGVEIGPAMETDGEGA